MTVDISEQIFNILGEWTPMTRGIEKSRISQFYTETVT